jgi:hypothetical protein
MGYKLFPGPRANVCRVLNKLICILSASYGEAQFKNVFLTPTPEEANLDFYHRILFR